jgi:signal transduction histidine kinase
MGELASQRARPWLTATSLVTLGLSLVVGFGVTGVTVVTPLVLVDLLGAMLLAAQVVLLGQAIVSYEVFTGKTLPRRGLARYWRNALILAAGFGGLMAISLGLPLDQSYRLLLALVIVAIFYALLSWRSFVERERSLDQLRPFVASERLVDHLLTLAPAPTPGEALTPRPRHGANIGCADVPLPALTNDGAPPLRGIPVSGEGAPVGAGLAPPAPSPAPPAVSSVSPATPPASRVPAPLSRAPGTVEGLGVRAGASDPFIALCERLLGARVAFLCPAGPLASLVGVPLAIPSTASPPSSAALADLVARIGSARQLCLPIEPSTHGDATWVVPLWGERSLIGLLLLGDRHDGSLYAQEEIEIARAAGERLIDARAAGELARRLLLLQRRRLAEDQILDGRVRRALHDDVLPLLHTALLTLNSRRHDQPPSADTPPTEAAALLADAHRQISELLASLPPALAPDVARLGLVGALRRVVDDLGSEIDGVQWRIDPDGEVAAAALSPLAAEVLFGAAREAIRNAARHARSDDRSRLLHLGIVVASHDDELTLQIQDDGVGLAASADTQSDGLGGQGLMLHGTLLTVLGGTLAVDSTHGNGTRVTLRVPSPG